MSPSGLEESPARGHQVLVICPRCGYQHPPVALPAKSLEALETAPGAVLNPQRLATTRKVDHRLATTHIIGTDRPSA